MGEVRKREVRLGEVRVREVRVGEVIEVTSLQGSFSLVSGILSVVVLGLFALLTNGPGDDDDSNGSGGGGLMQPIA